MTIGSEVAHSLHGPSSTACWQLPPMTGKFESGTLTCRSRRDKNDALTQVFDGNTDYTIYVTFSSDDRLLASAGDDRMVYLLDRTTTSPELEGSYNTNPRARFDFRASRIRSVTFSPDGKRVAASAYDELRIWDRESGSFVVRNQAQPFTSLRFSGIPHVDKSWILTEMGPVFVGDSELTMTLPLMEPWPALASWSIDSGGEWIKYKGKEVIFLPRRYRYYPGAVFVQGSRVTIGCRSGIVMLLKFSEDEELLEKHLGAP